MNGPSKEELEKNAKTAYQQVPTQQEMLSGKKQPIDTKQKVSGDHVVNKALDKELDEAAQQGNIGGG